LHVDLVDAKTESRGRAVAGVFRIGIKWQAPRGKRRSSFTDMRWSLTGSDPAAGLLSGRIIASDGAAIPYRLWKAEGEPRALVLLLHGAFDYSGAFDEVGPALAKQGYTALAYDQRGFGSTVSRGRWRGVKRMVRDVADMAGFLRERNVGTEPLFIIGESMGGAIAAQAAALYPGLDISGLVLAAPGALAGIWRRMIVTALLRAVQWIAPRGEVVCERISGWELTPAAAIRLLIDPMILRMVRPNMMFGLARLARGAIDLAHDVRVPTLTMVGAKDDFVRIRCMKQLYCRFAGPKEWALFEGAPHLLLHWQHNGRVLTHAVEWMERHIAANDAAAGSEAAKPEPIGRMGIDSE
jgi:acylglycerol lipase